MPRMLVLTHSPTSALEGLTEAVLAGAGHEDLQQVEVVRCDALAFARGEADHTDLLAADGFVLLTPANFGYMSGALKHVFDSTFLAIGGALDEAPRLGEHLGPAPASTRDRPFGLVVHGRYDTTGAVRSVLSITGALRWRQGYDVLEVTGDVEPKHLEAAGDLGATIASLVLP